MKNLTPDPGLGYVLMSIQHDVDKALSRERTNIHASKNSDALYLREIITAAKGVLDGSVASNIIAGYNNLNVEDCNDRWTIRYAASGISNPSAWDYVIEVRK